MPLTITIRRTALTVATLVALYGAVGVLVVPRVVRQALEQYAHDHGHTVRIGSIVCNPYTLSVRATAIDFSNAADVVDLSISDLSVRLGWSTLLGQGTVLRDLRIGIGALRASRRADGSVDLSDLLPPSDPNSPWPHVRVGTFQLQAHDLRYADPAAGPGASVALTTLTLSAQDFSTQAPSSAWTLALSTDRQETAAVQAQLTLEPFGAATTVQVTGFALARFGPEWAGLLPQIEGRVDASAAIQWNTAGHPGLSVQGGQVSGLATALALPPHHGPHVSLARWSLGDVNYDSAKNTLQLGKIALHSPHLGLVRTAEGLVGLGGTAGPSSTLQVDIGAVSLDDGQVHLDDRALAKPLQTTVSAIRLAVGAPNSKGRTVSAEAKLGAAGHLLLDGVTAADGSTVEMGLQASRLPMAPFDPYIAPFVAIRLDAGFLSAAGHIAYDGHTARYTGNAGLDQIRTADAGRQRDFLGLEHLRAQGIDARWPDTAIHVHSILIDAPYADVRIAPDRKSNLSSLLTAGTESTPGPSPSVSVDELHISKGRLYFADESLSPTFDANIADLEGHMVGLSTDPSNRAHLTLSGHVDRYAPVSIEGDVNVLGDPVSADVQMHFDNLEMTLLSPYSGRFAGYNIRKGKAAADLKYHVADGHVDAAHHLRLSQFELGNRVEGSAGFGVPLGLVVALLKDSDGNIDLDVPLSGSFRDPDFHLGPVIRKIIGNLFRKIVTSPFALLGSLFGAGEEISDIAFQPGSAELDASARSRLATLAKGMTARPSVNIEVPIATSTADALALAEQRYRETLLQRARERLDGADDATLLARLTADPVARRTALLAALGLPAADAPNTDPAQLEAELRQRTTPTADDLEQLAATRAQGMQAALVEGTGVDAGRVFLVRGSSAEATTDGVHLKLALR